MNETAEQVYERTTASVQEKIERLRKRLQTHRGDFLGPKGLYGKDWGFVGDLSRIERLLAQAINEED